MSSWTIFTNHAQVLILLLEEHARKRQGRCGSRYGTPNVLSAVREGFVEARESVVRNGLPTRSVGNELATLRANAWITVDHTESDEGDLVAVRRLPEERGAASAAKHFRETARWRPSGEETLALHHTERSWRYYGSGRRRRPRPPLTASAVAVTGCLERSVDLEPDRFASAVSSERRSCHSGKPTPPGEG